jgi:hypothetical protein
MQAGESKDPGSLILGNQYEFHRVQEISINYTSFGEFSRIGKSCFSTMVANLLNDPDPKTMAE